ncbi:unnamed protein product [Dovyalis caffra]|uniref:Uncharacterized protein n=1 Tax=Dovyalis caffra TaxID=77055 RepID=A0AAV1RZS2_9ROSI|nr:unnamed protein product [Dovyalis caffra]
MEGQSLLKVDNKSQLLLAEKDFKISIPDEARMEIQQFSHQVYAAVINSPAALLRMLISLVRKLDFNIFGLKDCLESLNKCLLEPKHDGKGDERKKTDFHKLVVVSLGTGAPNERDRLEVGDGEWGIGDWLWHDDNSHPLLDILMTAADESTEMYVSNIFQYSGLEHNYTRLQASLTLKDAIMDDPSQNNLENLKKIGEDLATKNDAKLEALARRLIDIRKARQ